jgi:hypothetical protein
MQWDPHSIVAQVSQPLQFGPHSLELFFLLDQILVQPTQSCVDRVAFLWATMVSQCGMVRCIVALFGTVNCNLVSSFNSEMFFTFVKWHNTTKPSNQFTAFLATVRWVFVHSFTPNSSNMIAATRPYHCWALASSSYRGLNSMFSSCVSTHT